MCHYKSIPFFQVNQPWLNLLKTQESYLVRLDLMFLSLTHGQHFEEIQHVLAQTFFYSR